MTPPNHGDAGIYALAGLLAFLILLSAYRRREVVGQKLRHLFLGIGSFALTVVIARQFTTDPIRIGLAALLVELIVMVRTKPVRSRYIPRSEKRKAIARYERKSGKRYDPKRHHLDHVIPYARGGSNKADNLRVLDSERNLAKSDRSPWWDVFSR